MDEPFGALDAITRYEVQASFLEIRQQANVTAVLVTHDLHEAVRLATHVAVMKSGQIVHEGTAGALLEATDPYVTDLLAKSGLARPEPAS